MAAEHPRRPRRNPLTAEEVAEIIALKKRKAHFKLHMFKRTLLYKALNIFIIVCFFFYLELLLCFYGPCLYSEHVATKITGNYGIQFNLQGQQIISDIEVETEEGKKYKFVVNSFKDVPPEGTVFYVGQDYLLRKDLKGIFAGEEDSYRIFAASPILFLSVLVLVASFIGFVYNLNEYAYSLSAISVLNGLTLLAILCY